MGTPQQPLLLLVEDDAPLRRSLVLTLADEGFRVLEAADGKQGLRQLPVGPAAVLLDLGLPDINGFELCALIRESTPAPILILSADRAPADLARGLAAGADDYLTKPFTAAELSRRVRALLQQQPTGGTWTVGGLELAVDGAITCQGDTLALTSTEQRVLVELADSPDGVDREVLAERVWGFPPAAGGEAVEARIRSLRVKLGRCPGSASISDIGTGYRLHA